MKTVRTDIEKLDTRARNAITSLRARASAEGAGALDYTIEDLLKLAQDTRNCPLCGKSTVLDGQFGHRTPTSRGGTHTLANVLYLCGKCNRMKGDVLTAGEVVWLLGLLSKFPTAAREYLESRLLSGWGRHARR